MFNEEDMIYKITDKNGNEVEFDDVDDLLDHLPEHKIRSYAEYHFDMKEEYEHSLSNYDDADIIEEAMERDITFIWPENIVEEIEIEKLTNWYNNASPDERRKVIGGLPT